MPSRFDKYRFTKRTVLSDETFNAIFKDIDLRIAALEDIKKDWRYAINEVTRYGLLRIEEVLRPSFNFIEEKKSEVISTVSEIRELRNNADQMINERRDDALIAIEQKRLEAVSQTQAVKTDALQAIEQKRQQTLSQIETAKTEAISQIETALITGKVSAFFFGGD